MSSRTISRAVTALLGASLLSLVACGSGPPSRSEVRLGVRVAPPAPRVLVVPAERRGYVWAPGYWRQRGNRYTWVDGHYVRARQGEHWVADRYERRGEDWYYVAGHWER